MKLSSKNSIYLSSKWIEHKSLDGTLMKLPCLFTQGEELVKAVYLFAIDLMGMPKYSNKTIPTYVENIKNFLNYVFSTEHTTMGVDDEILLINNFQLDGYFMELRRLDRSVAYIHNIDASLRTFFNWLAGESTVVSSGIFKNPYHNCKYRTVRPKSVIFRGIADGDLIAYLDAPLLPITYKIMLLFTLCTGVRRRELCEWRIESFRKHKLIGDRFLVEVEVPNAKEKGGLYTFRQVIIPWLLFDELNKYTESRKQFDSVFLNTRGKAITTTAFSNMILRVSKKLEAGNSISHRISPHKFRHTFAFKFLSYNEGQYSFPVQIELSKLLGHSSLKSLRSYNQIPFVRLEEDRKMSLDNGFRDMYDELNTIINRVLYAKTN